MQTKTIFVTASLLSLVVGCASTLPPKELVVARETKRLLENSRN